METKYESLKFTKSEIDAIKIYIDYKHFDIDYIFNNNISQIIEDTRSFYIDNSIENLKNNIKIISNIYSAMYKYAKTYGDLSICLFSGILKEDLTFLNTNKNYTNFLRLTSSKDIAIDSINVGTDTIIEIKTNGNIPYININNILNNDEISNLKYEYIISPFYNIDKISKNILETIEYYNVAITDYNLPNFTEDEKNNILVFIQDNIHKLNPLLKEYKDISANINNTTSRSEALYKRKEKIINEYTHIKNKLIDYIKICCKEKELEIEENIRIEKDKITKKYIQENQVIISDLKKLQINKHDKLSYEYKQHNKDFDTTTDICKQIADEFDINYTPDISKSDYTKYLNIINENLKKLKEQISNITIEESDSFEDTNNKILELKKFNQKLEIIQQLLNEVKTLTMVYKDNSFNTIKSKIQIIVNNSIICDKKNKLIIAENNIKNLKTSLIDKLSGKDKLIKAKLDNIKLKKELLKYDKNLCSSIDPNKMLSYLDEYTEVECYGETPEQLNYLRNKLMLCFNIEGKKIINNKNTKKNSKLVSTDDYSNIAFIKNKLDYNILTTQNIELKEILNEYTKTTHSESNNTSDYSNSNTKSLFEKLLSDLSSNFAY